MFGKVSDKLVIAVLGLALIAAMAAVALVLLKGGARLGSEGGSSSVAGQDQAQPPQFPRMQLQQQYAGPLVGTTIQRWRDPVDGTVCYIYVPMVVHHDPAPSGFVQYGPNAIGAISCLPGTAQVPAGPAPR